MAKPRQECRGDWTGWNYRTWKCPVCEAERPDDCPLLQDDPLADDTRERVADMRSAR